MPWLSPGVWCLAVCGFLFGLAKSQAYSRAVYVGGFAQCMAMVFILYGVLALYPRRQVMFRPGTLALYSLVVVWSVIVTFHGFRLEYRYIRDLWGAPYGAWALLMPAVMILGGSLSVWRRLFGIVGVMCVVLVPALIVGIAIGFRTEFGLAAAAPQILLFWSYLPHGRRGFVLFATLVTLFFAVMWSARTDVLTCGLLLLSAVFIEFFRQDRWRSKRQTAILLVVSCAFVLGLYMTTVREIPGAPRWVNVRLSKFFDEATVNTRVVKGHNLYTAFLQDFTASELLVGRGAMGTYSVDLHLADRGNLTKQRYQVECGYLQIVMNGGLILLAGFLCLVVPSIYLGIFRTQNLVTRACALIIVVRLVAMVPFGLPVTRVEYFIFWLAVGCCWSPVLRRVSETEMARYLGGDANSFRVRTRGNADRAFIVHQCGRRRPLGSR